MIVYASDLNTPRIYCAQGNAYSLEETHKAYFVRVSNAIDNWSALYWFDASLSIRANLTGSAPRSIEIEEHLHEHLLSLILANQATSCRARIA